MSFFTSLINIRDKLGEQAQINANLMTILDPETVLSQNASIQIDSIALDYDHNNDVITFTNYSLSEDNTISISRNEFPDKLDVTIPGTSIKVSDYMASANNSGELYQALSLLTAKFSYTSRIPLKDINDILDAATSTNATIGYNFRDLKYSLVNCSNDEGFITGRAWLVLLKEWFKNGDDTVAGGAASLDEQNPFSLQGIINVVLTSIFTALSYILVAVHSILSVILGVIVNLVSKVFGTINDYLNSGLEVDWDTPNNFIQGSVMHYEEDPAYLNLIGIGDNLPKTRQIFYAETYGVARFFWWNDEYTKIRMNYYLQPTYTASRVANYISIYPAHIHYQNFGATAGCVFRTALQNLDISGSDEDENEIFSTPRNIMLSICVDAFVRELLSQSATSWGSHNPADFPSDASHEYGISGTMNDAVGIGARAVSNVIRGLDQFNNISFTVLQDAVVDYVKNNFDDNYSRDNQMHGTPAGSNSYSDYYTVTSFQSYPYDYKEIRTKIGFSGPNALGFFYVRYDISENPTFLRQFNFTPNGFTPLVESNGLPSQWKVSLNSITLSFVIFLTVSTAIIATAAAYGYLKACKAIRQRRIIKQRIRTDKIEKAKKAWDNDPNNADKAKAYAKEVDSFNRVGRILGWGSYDAANGWVDLPNKGGSNPNLLAQSFTTLFNSDSAKTAAISAATTAGLISQDTAAMLNGTTGIAKKVENTTYNQIASQTLALKSYIDSKMRSLQDWITSNLINLIK